MNKIFCPLRTEPEWASEFRKFQCFSLSSSNKDFIVRHLCGKSVIKGITVTELYCLDRFLISEWETFNTREQDLFLTIVSLSGASRKRATSWETRLRPTLSRLKLARWNKDYRHNGSGLVTDFFDSLALPIGGNLEISTYPVWSLGKTHDAYSGWTRGHEDHGSSSPPHIVKDPLGFEPDLLDFETFALSKLLNLRQRVYISASS